MNSGRPRTNPASGQSGTRTRDRRIASPTRWPLGHAASQAINRQATINKLCGGVNNKQQFSGNTSKVVHGRPYKIKLDFEKLVILIFEEKGKP